MVPPQVWAAAAAVVAALPLAWWAVAGARAPSRSVSHNLAGGRATVADVREAVLARSAGERAVRPLVDSAARTARRLTPAGIVESLERRIVLAGLQGRWPIERVLAAKLLLAFAGLGLGLWQLSGSFGVRGVLVAVVLAAVGYLLPDVMLWSRARERQAAIRRTLADTLDQITISVEAGLGFESALSRVAHDGTGPLAEEITRTLSEIQVGIDRQTALRRLSERNDVADLRQFVSAVLQAEAYGVPIARVLRVQANELRTKRSQRAEELAMKIPVKIVFPLILCILPALFVVILGPAAIRIADTLMGDGGVMGG